MQNREASTYAAFCCFHSAIIACSCSHVSHSGSSHALTCQSNCSLMETCSTLVERSQPESTSSASSNETLPPPADACAQTNNPSDARAAA